MRFPQWRTDAVAMRFSKPLAGDPVWNTHSDLNRRRRTLDAMADRLVSHTSENGVESKLDADLTLFDTK
jgi:hypothetical protein